MLTALEQGVKGGKWFSLIDKVYRPANLQRAFARVKANKGAAGVDYQTIEMFEQHLETNLEHLASALKDGSYGPQALRREWIAKPGSSEKRPLGIPTVRDRVVETAMRAVLEPIFERDFAEHSYGFRPKRGCKEALRRVNYLLKQGYNWVVDADLKSYYDTIPRATARPGGRESRGRTRAGLACSLPATRGDGRNEAVAARSGYPARGGHQSVAFQHLSQPLGPSDGRERVRDGTVCR